MSSWAIVIGAGPGLGAALAKRFAREGCHVALLARNAERLTSLQKQIVSAGGQATPFACDVTSKEDVDRAFGLMKEQFQQNRLEVAVYNTAAFSMSPFLSISPEKFESDWKTMTLGAFLCSQKIVDLMAKQNHGTLIFTGATASVRGSSGFASMASAKFGLRALSQSLSREFHPQGIHVAHVIIDGYIDTEQLNKTFGPGEPGTRLDTDAIANEFWNLHSQDRSTWTQELDLRPFSESF
ncbi:short-chain dehydrogenase/reductase SDR [Polychytrium aggregatum]|uniref:short-chain dehydrogenase/reductase SDR n=1 Tax=Polychytrium aggregatum TaxID=110093 RepID=UPI0022FE1640|nr:short-chain dehydrogenase/reductase SDR [Polychytrium aggregatum]KAI9209144.1 short-chain dehydrogenase/reductase SDR [Polychytrium aggregatum]